MKIYCLIFTWFFICHFKPIYSQNLLTDNFSDGIIKNWHGNKNFEISEKNKVLTISIDKNPWESFTLDLKDLKFNKNFVVSFDVKTNKLVALRLDLHNVSKRNTHDTHYEGKKVPSHVNVIEVNPNPVKVSYNFSSKMNRLDKSNLSHISFYADPGSEFNGILEISNFKISSQKAIKEQKQTR